MSEYPDVISVVEYQSLGSTFDENDTTALNGLCLGGNTAHEGILARHAGTSGVTFRATNYVGLITLPSGTIIEVLPKIRSSPDEVAHAEARRVLLELVLNWYSLARVVNLSTEQHLTSHVPLPDALTAIYLKEIDILLRRGLRSGFRKVREPRESVRGRIAWNEQLRGYRGVSTSIVCEYDQFSADRPENRLLRWSLHTLKRIVQTKEVRNSLQELDWRLSHIPPSTVPKDDFRRWSRDRNLHYYRKVKPWIRMIIDMLSPAGIAGTRAMPALMFPAERLFERWVESSTKSALPNIKIPDGLSLNMTRQSSARYLALFQTARWFQLKPDIILSSSKSTNFVIDAKWKLLDASRAGAEEKYGISQLDLYQMQAYLSAYDCDHGILVYPEHPDFPTALRSDVLRLNDGRQVALCPVRFDQECAREDIVSATTRLPAE